MVRIAVERKRCHGRNARRQAREILRAVVSQARQRRHDGSAVHDGQALLRPQAQRLDARFAQGIRRCNVRIVAPYLAFATQYRCQVGQRRQVAARADRTFRGNHRQQVLCEQARDLLQQIDRNARIALAQRRQARRHDGARLGRREILPQPAAVIGIQMVRQFADQVRRYVDRARIAVTGGHAVDRAVFAQQAVEEIGAARDGGAKGRIVGQLGLRRPAGDVDDIFDAQTVLVETDCAARRLGSVGVSGLHRDFPIGVYARIHKS